MNWFLRQIIKMSSRKLEIAKVTTEPRPKSDKEFRILTVRELAGYLRVHQTTVYRLLKVKKLPAFRVVRIDALTAKRSTGGCAGNRSEVD
jgi:excisionase family DNA binding protein